jgi:signal recognition particle subunit SRP19
MVEKHDRIWAIYPEYFDAGITRLQGRKVRTDLALPTPTLDELFDCARKLNLTPVKEPSIAYPAFWWKKRGRLLVRKEWSKTETLERLGTEYVEYRKIHGLPGEKDDSTVSSKKLVPRKPHKGAKGKGSKPTIRSWKDRKKGHKDKKGKR